jgi:CubicO group peptidase (beta-lactamase class C family)
MKVTKPLLIVLIILFFQSFILKAQISSEKLDDLVKKSQKKFNVAGVAVAVVKDGKIVHAKGYGITSIKSQKKVDKFTPFAIASNSKAFTTTALAMLVEEGKLSWNDKVKDYIPEFKMYNDYVTENFTIQDLLTHRSGLGLGAGDLMFFPDGSDFTFKDIASCFQYFKPQSPFRTKFDYDNLLYIVAGEVIKKVSGMPWEEFISKRIFSPLQMNHSYSSVLQVRDKTNLAMPHANKQGVLQLISIYPEMVNGAAGGILSNAQDLSQWMLLQLNKGKYGKDLKNTLFSEKSQSEMWKIHTSIGNYRNKRYKTHFLGYGLGWFINDLHGNLEIWHTGGLPGMLSKIVLIPDLNLGIVVLTNTENGGTDLFTVVTQTIVDSYLGLDNFNWLDKMHEAYITKQKNEDTFTKKVWETVKKADTTCVNLKDYVGVYKDNWFGKVAVFFKGNQLWFKSYRSPKLNGPMYFYKANTFTIKWEYQDMNADAFAMFTLDENGKAKEIKMKGISPNIDFSFDFQDLDLKWIE